MAQWYVVRNGEEQGPLTSGQLKELASTGKLRPVDLIRREDLDAPAQAQNIMGLFPDNSPPVSPPPPIRPKESAANGPATSPKAANSEDAPLTKTRWREFVGTAKQAKELAQSHARKTQLTKSSLPKAYLALGKDVYERKTFQDELGDIFGKLTEKPDDRSLLRQLGRRAFESHGENAGPDQIVSQITSYRAEIEKLDAEIERLSAEGKGKLLTPRRLMFAGVAVTGLFVLIGLSAMFGGGSGSTGSKREPEIAVTAEKLLADYKANEVAADEKYKGKLLEVSGTVDHVAKGLFGESYVTLKSGKQFDIHSVQCYFRDSSVLKSLSPGRRIQLRGRCGGLLGNVSMKDCEFVE